MLCQIDTGTSQVSDNDHTDGHCQQKCVKCYFPCKKRKLPKEAPQKFPSYLTLNSNHFPDNPSAIL